MIRATFRMETGDADTLLSAVSPETFRELPRSRVTASAEDGSLVLEIVAEDSSAMRATLNSYLGCVRIAQEIKTVAGEGKWKK